MNMRPPAEKEKVALRLNDPAENRYLELTFGNGGGTQCRLVPEQAFPKGLGSCLQTLPCPPVNAGDEPYWVTFKRSENFWGVYVGDQLIFRAPELWAGTASIEHLPESLPEEEEKDDYTQRFGSFAFEDNFLVPAGSAFPPTWEIISGTWKLHSVTGSMSGVSAGYQLARQPLPEKSPNFYSLEGSGTNAVVLAGEYFYSHYLVRAAVQHNIGTNGIVFLAGEQGGYLAFTARTAADTDRIILELWRQPPNPEATPIPLAAVQTELPLGQWLLLEAQLFDDRIICRADNIEVIRMRLNLPPGGRFGFFCNVPDGESTRFDDVVATTHGDRLFESVEDVQMVTQEQSAGVRAFPHKDASMWMYFPPCADEDQMNEWRFGAEDAMPLRQEVTFVATSDDFTCGLTLGNTASPDMPFYRFSCTQADGKRVYLLEGMTNSVPVVLDRFETAFTSNRVTLAMDPLKPNDLRCLADGKTVCFRRPSKQPSGRLGVFAQNGSALFFTAPQVTSRDATLSDRFEKNPLYVNDPFMKNWASPEGAWITFPDGMTWFKGDLLGPTKIRLPIVNGMNLHIFIPEGEKDGLCRVVTRDRQISLYTPESGEEPAFTVDADTIPKVTIDKVQYSLFTIGLTDHVLWIGGDEVLMEKTHLQEPPRGRRMRVVGMTPENLKQTLVKRENVFDTLFTEALFNWTINGGVWEVINRFYCEPTWSHMNGENGDGLAALWSKYVFSGDFSVEFYAGMRMGWYERAGDLNLSVMSKKNATSDGYTAIATGWDPDYSQLYSRLLRQGEIIDSSTKYMVPRYRAGSVRKGYDPHTPPGVRDIHGSWYGIQFRRIGNRLQYIYDNEPVFEADDPTPLQDGSLGMWTYRNSMMVARIRISAEDVRPRPFAFKPIPLSQPPAPPKEAVADSGVRINGRTLHPFTSAHWEPGDEVSHPTIRFLNENTAKPEMRVTSTLGAGSFLTRCTLPPVLPSKLLGWQFEIARHPQARINFEFSTVKDDGKGGFAPLQGWTYILNGTDETRGPRKIIGSLSDLPASAPDATGNDIVWTPVEIWIPSEIYHADQMVQVEGFGNLQPSDMQQGLGGNPPDAWYAIRAFREIHRGTPTLTVPPEKRQELAAFTETIGTLRPGELQMLEVPAALDPCRPVIQWAVPELASFGLRATADPKIIGSIIVTPTHPWPSPVLPPQSASVDANPAPFLAEGNNLRILVPYDILKPERMTLSLTLADGRIFRQVVPMNLSGSEGTHPPILLSLEMPDGGGLNTFEERPCDPAPHQVTAIASIDYSDTLRGGVLKFSNGGVPWRRLSSQIVKAFDPMLTPILQFRYKADPMASVGMDFGWQNRFSFTESYFGKLARPNTDLAPADNEWHVFTCLPTDGMGSKPLAQRIGIWPTFIRVGSFPTYDMTGRHSTLLVDDLACGPAAGPERPLTFKANYADPSGITDVTYMIISGAIALDNRPEDERQTLLAGNWTPAPNSEVVVPDITALPDGFYHLLVRARNARGIWSHPADVPFAVLKTPPTISASVAATTNYNGSCLNLSVSSPLLLPNINTLQLSCRGTHLPLHTDNGQLTLGTTTASYEIDWIWLLRKHLTDIKHGETIPISVTGLTDLAGNPAAPFTFDIPVLKENDTRPPTVLLPSDPTNTFCFGPTVPLMRRYSPTPSGGATAVSDTPEGSVITLTSDASNTPCTLQHTFTPPNAWNPNKHPWLHYSYRVSEDTSAGHPFTLTFGTGPAGAARRARGGGAAPGNNTLNLNLSANNAYIISPPAAPGEWRSLLVNARAFMLTQVEGDVAPDITSLTLTMTARTRGAKVQFRAFSILAPWRAETILPIRAYDINGIKGIVWQPDGFSAETAIRPASLVLPEAQSGAFTFRISDGVGNLSGTWVIPVPPNPTLKPTLPAFEAVP